MVVTRRRVKPPWSVDVGRRGEPSLHAAVRGSFELACGELRARSIGAGDVVVIRGRSAELRCVGGDPAEVISATYPSVSDSDPRFDGVPAVIHLEAARVGRARGLATLVSLLDSALSSDDAAEQRLAHSLVEPLLAHAIYEHLRGQRLGSARRSDPRVARALDRMRERPADRWTVEALAKAAGLSRAAFARRFLADTGVPPLRFLAEHRMALAARLLAEGDESLAHVAAAVGYESEFAFSRAFKRHNGEAPGAFRRRMRGGAAPATPIMASLRAAA